MRTNARRSAADAKSRGVMRATKMSFLAPCAFRISATPASLAEPGVLSQVPPAVMDGTAPALAARRRPDRGPGLPVSRGARHRTPAPAAPGRRPAPRVLEEAH